MISSSMADEETASESKKKKLKIEYQNCKSDESEQEDLWTNCLEIVRKNFENNFTCHVCNKGFRDRWRLKLHEKVHNSSEKVLPHIFDAYTSSQKGTGNKKYVDNGETNDSKGDRIEKLYAFGKPSAIVDTIARRT